MESLLSGLNRQREKRYIRARYVIKDLVKILVEKYHIKKIILIGSCLNKNSFHFHSDIDLCVKGLEGSLYFKALGELLIKAGEFNVDLIPIENATERMKGYIDKGEVLYSE
ncbi:MAG: nucleotidyltransferase domain-containing protein [Candidatus Kuenenia sp.]|nr:nucleotidyltransferase domain-containing protein [Candidatus Kuenenia hertensis]